MKHTNLTQLDRTVIVVEHENGTLHFRCDPLAQGHLVKAFTALRLPCRPDLDWQDRTDDPRHAGYVTMRDVFLDVELDREGLADLQKELQRWVRRLYIFTGGYEPGTPGPTWRFRPFGPVSPGLTGSVLCSIDYGGEDGTWFFGHPEIVCTAHAFALQEDLTRYGVQRDPWGRVTCFAVDSGTQGPVQLAAEAAGLTLWADIFRPC